MTKDTVHVIPMQDPSVDALIAEAFGREPILLQLPTVFAIFAPATAPGAASLNHCKQRLPGKYYGAGVGDPRAFFQLAPQAPLSRYLLADTGGGSRLDAFCADLHGTFLRLKIGPASLQSQVICEGRFQGLIYTGLLAEKMRWMEALTRPMTDKLFGPEYGGYCAPIGSSCNISGDPAGSITTLDKALAFARDRGIRLCLTRDEHRDEQGSQTVLGLDGPKVIVHRHGPGTDTQQRRLQDWLDRAYGR